MTVFDNKKELLSDPNIVNKMIDDLRRELSNILADKTLSDLRKSIFIQGVMDYTVVICAYSTCLEEKRKAEIFHEFANICNEWFNNYTLTNSYIN